MRLKQTDPTPAPLKLPPSEPRNGNGHDNRRRDTKVGQPRAGKKNARGIAPTLESSILEAVGHWTSGKCHGYAYRLEIETLLGA